MTKKNVKLQVTALFGTTDKTRSNQCLKIRTTKGQKFVTVLISIFPKLPKCFCYDLFGVFNFEKLLVDYFFTLVVPFIMRITSDKRQNTKHQKTFLVAFVFTINIVALFCAWGGPLIRDGPLIT